MKRQDIEMFESDDIEDLQQKVTDYIYREENTTPGFKVLSVHPTSCAATSYGCDLVVRHSVTLFYEYEGEEANG